MAEDSGRFSEPWSKTIVRTVGLAVAIGMGVGLYERRVVLGLITAVLALWFTLGGHFVELLCRNELRPRLPSGPVALLARLTAWFLGGAALTWGALATRGLLTGRWALPVPWWGGGMLFIAAELVVHLGMRGRGQPSVYDGRG